MIFNERNDPNQISSLIDYQSGESKLNYSSLRSNISENDSKVYDNSFDRPHNRSVDSQISEYAIQKSIFEFNDISRNDYETENSVNKLEFTIRNNKEQEEIISSDKKQTDKNYGYLWNKRDENSLNLNSNNSNLNENFNLKDNKKNTKSAIQIGGMDNYHARKIFINTSHSQFTENNFDYNKINLSDMMTINSRVNKYKDGHTSNNSNINSNNKNNSNSLNKKTIDKLNIKDSNNSNNSRGNNSNNNKNDIYSNSNNNDNYYNTLDIGVTDEEIERFKKNRYQLNTSNSNNSNSNINSNKYKYNLDSNIKSDINTNQSGINNFFDNNNENNNENNYENENDIDNDNKMGIKKITSTDEIPSKINLN